VPLGELLASEERIADLAAALARGGVAAVPTETFYALAAGPRSREGVERVLAAKGREEGKPLLVLFAARPQLSDLGVAAPASALDAFFALWPAPLTVVLPLSAPIPASLGLATLGVRMPDHPQLLRLLARVGPLTGTSANRAGEPACADPDEVARIFGGRIDVLVDGGRTPGGLPSTLVDATSDPPRVLREGAFPYAVPSPREGR
jgi:L-threonylcarbamoyladenylate synthase